MITLHIPDMSCGHCVKAITVTVHKLDAKAHVQCDVTTHVVIIDTHVAREPMAKALADEGYAPA
jgi:copper chaperone